MSILILLLNLIMNHLGLDVVSLLLKLTGKILRSKLCSDVCFHHIKDKNEASALYCILFNYIIIFHCKEPVKHYCCTNENILPMLVAT